MIIYPRKKNLCINRNFFKICSDSEGSLLKSSAGREKRSRSSQDMFPRKGRKKPKIRGPRNYNLKSREVVSDSDSDSSSEADNKSR